MIYEALAPLYDRIMSHVEYRQWALMLAGVIRDFSAVKRPAILEVGAGTGVLGNALRSQGWRYQGSDLSFAMCREAKKRGLSFFCADALRLPLRQAFDMIIFLYDGINYLMVPADYQRLFVEIAQYLNPGGLFLFDVTTEANSLKNFSDLWAWDELDGRYCLRHSYYDRIAKVQYNDFVIFSRQRDGAYQRSDERHVQRVVAPAEILCRIPADAFEVVGVWNGFSRKRDCSNAERIHFLLRKQPRG